MMKSKCEMARLGYCKKSKGGYCNANNDDIEKCPYLEMIECIAITSVTEYGIWEPIVNAIGELVEFICDCGHGSTIVSNYCPNCGKKMDNSTIEQRIQQAIEEN